MDTENSFARFLKVLHDSDELTQTILYSIQNNQKLTHSEQLELEQRLAKQLLLPKIAHAYRKEIQRLIEDLDIKPYPETLTFYELMKEQKLLSPRFIEFFEKMIFQHFDQNEDKFNEMLNEEVIHYPEYILPIFAVIPRLWEYIHADTFTKIINASLYYPSVAHELAKLNYLKKISFWDGASSQDTWWYITRSLLNHAPAQKKYSFELVNQLTNQMQIKSSSIWNEEKWVKHSFTLSDKLTEGWQFLRTQGRTILLQNKNGDVLAIKIQKQKENASELDKEYLTTRYLREHSQELHLDCHFPQAKGIFRITHNVIEWLKPYLTQPSLEAFQDMVGTHPSYTAYVYQVDHNHTDYFTYLHNPKLSDQEFATACRSAITNLCKLLGQGLVYAQLGDIFHNKEHKDEREDKGRYIVLANLLSPLGIYLSNLYYIHHEILTGSGRLTNWKGAVEYPNVRGPLSPLADMGDWVAIRDCMYQGEWAKKYFHDAYLQYKEKIGNYIIANILAEYLYIFFLIAGCRGYYLTEQAKEEGKDANDIAAIWQRVAEQVMENSVMMISSLSLITEARARTQLHIIVDVTSLARQMQFWMTDEYIPYIQNNRIPQDIYGEKTKTEVAFDRIRKGTFNPQLGFSIDGVHADLGTVNGQEPIKEANKLFYWTNNMILASFYEFKLTLEDLVKIKKEKDPQKIVELCETSTRAYAAATIQRFWRTHKKSNETVCSQEHASGIIMGVPSPR